MSLIHKMIRYVGALLLLTAAASFAHANSSDYEPGGRYDYGFSPSPNRPAPGHEGYNDYHRRQELADRQAQEWRDEAQRQYRSAPPVDPQSRYVYPEDVRTPDGSWMSCTKGGSGTTYCQRIN